MTDTTELLRHSVTRDDANDDPRGGVYRFMWANSGPVSEGLPPYWSRARDIVLRKTLQMESMWASAVSKAISKQVALGFRVTDMADSGLRVKRGQEMFLGADNVKGLSRGWAAFLAKHLRSFLLADNGAFVEIIRATGASGSRILGIAHLDSNRCTRTGDPEVPVIYQDRFGKEHLLKWYQVFALSDMPDDGETWFGVGFCAASRAWDTIHKMAYIEQYIREKTSGNRATAINIISGISEQSMRNAFNDADQEQARRGLISYRGVMLIPSVKMDANISLVTIPIAEIPDGFDAAQERQNAYMIYANALGVPVQDIQPLSGQGLGTGTQSVVLAEAAEGQGLAAWRASWTHAVNEYLLPDTTTFAFSTNDIRDQKANAEVAKMRADTRATQVQTGEITPQQALQMAADIGDVPQEFLAQDETAGGTVSDSEKPITPEVSAEIEASQELTPALELSAEKATQRIRKQSAVDLLSDADVIAAAQKLYEDLGRNAR